MIHLHTLLPELARREMREMTIPPPGLPGIPPGLYGFLELYCQDPDCDCRRALISVFGKEQGRVVATISHSFDPPGRDALIPEQTFLDPLNPQSEWSKALLEVFLSLVLDEAYAARLVRHYEAVKRAVRDPNDPIHRRIPAGARPRASGLPRPPGSVAPPPPRRGRKKWR